MQKYQPIAKAIISFVSDPKEVPATRCSTADARAVPKHVPDLLYEHPHSIALSYGARQLTYEELDRTADKFADYLIRLGIVPGTTVALCMERSFDWVVAALGIMRSGAAYVPLDSSWPDSRLQFALTDSGACLLVARATLLDRLQCKVRGLDPCRDAALIAAAPEASRRSVEAESLAYVIYTSGSTGVPKGVEVTHSNLAYLIRWHRDAFNVTPQDRASHLAGLGFDAAEWEIWPNLAAGATVCLPDEAVRSSPGLLQEWIIQERVTIAFIPTVYAEPMIGMKWPAATSLRLLLTGGDVLHRTPPVQLPFDVINNYGVTECTVVSTSAVLESGSDGRPPIGRPITGTRVYLLNEQGELVPDGSCGEIYIGGDGVARGYRNLPDATERSFLPDPFVGVPGARMYRTGDRGSRRPDGELEFHGRLDRQTKIRGQRVELDEIASILTRHPGIAFATAITHIDDRGENQLAAYILPKENSPVPTTQELQQYLRHNLPDYMVPSIFIRLHGLPLSANGKLDLTMLEPPTEANLLERETVGSAATPIEKKLLAMMQELLENNDVRGHDNFFLAGGNSLLGMRLVLRLRNEFGVDLTVRQLFEAATTKRLAILVETMLDEAHLATIWADLLARNQVGSNDNFFDLGGEPAMVAILQNRILTEFGHLIPIADMMQSPTVRQQVELMHRRVKDMPELPRGVFVLQPHGTRTPIFWMHYLNGNLANALGDEQPFFTVKLSSEDVDLLGEAPSLQNIARRLTLKILAVQSTGPYIIGGMCLGGVLAYEVASQLRVSGYEVSLLVLVDTPNPSYFKSLYPLTPKLSEPRYLLKRAARLGLRTSLLKLREHLFERFVRLFDVESDKTEVRVPQRMLETAAFDYQSQKYEGKTLLLLASDRPPHVDFLPGWQAAVPFDLHAQYVTGHHNDLMAEQSVRSVADAIVSHAAAPSKDTPARSNAAEMFTKDARDGMMNSNGASLTR
jgi:amino acid adenylation domain-containing protein